MQKQCIVLQFSFWNKWLVFNGACKVFLNDMVWCNILCIITNYINSVVTVAWNNLRWYSSKIGASTPSKNSAFFTIFLWAVSCAAVHHCTLFFLNKRRQNNFTARLLFFDTCIPHCKHWWYPCIALNWMWSKKTIHPFLVTEHLKHFNLNI